MGRRTMTVAAVLLALAVCAPRAAASYEVDGCALDDGTPAPVEGWTFAAVTEQARGSDSCADPAAAPPSLSASMDWNTYWFGRVGGSTASSASWTFTAPPGTLIEGYRIYRYEDSTFTGAATPGVFGEVRWSSSDGPLDAGCTWAGRCVSHGDESMAGRLSSANLAAGDGLAVRWLRVSAVCTAVQTTSTACPTDLDVRHGRFRIYASRIRLRDIAPPTVLAKPSGGLLDPSRPLDGERTAHVTASDAGGGLARAVLYADGREVAEAPPDGPGCDDPTALVPCPLRASFTVVLDTRSLADGPHALELRVVDAGGNETGAGTAVVTVRNAAAADPPPAPLPTSAAPPPVAAAPPPPVEAPRFAALPARTVAFGAEPLLRGHVSTPHAAISVALRTARAGAPWHEQGAVEADAGGDFTLRVPAGPSRDVRLRSGAAELLTRVSVRAGLTLTAVRHGATVRLSGRLRGGPGRAGTRVELTPAGRHTGTIARCDAQGRFHATVRRAAAFTARLIPRVAYPYAAGTATARAR